MIKTTEKLETLPAFNKATVTLSGTFYTMDKNKVEEFSGLRINIPEEKAHKALSVCTGLLKRNLRSFLPKATRLAKCRIDSIESSTMDNSGKPIDVMSLEELIYVIKDKEMNIKVEEFTNISELRLVVKMYLVNDADAMAYIKVNRAKYNEEREIMELNPDMAARSNTYINPSMISEAKKVKVKKPDKNFNKVTIANLDSPDDKGDTDPNTGGTVTDDESEL